MFADVYKAIQNPSTRYNSLLISFGGITCHIISQDTAFLNTLRTGLGAAPRIGPVRYDIVLQVMSRSEFEAEYLKGTASPNVKRLKSENNYLIKQDIDPFIAVVNTFTRKVLAKMPRNLRSFESFLNTVFSLVLVEEQALLFDAFAIRQNNHAEVYFGMPDCGKTVGARLSLARTLITDDKVIIRKHGGRYQAFGVPFAAGNGGSRTGEPVDIGAVYLLREGPQNRVEKLDRAKSVVEVFKNALFFSDDSRLLGNLFRASSQLAEAVPIYRLHFRPDLSFWQLPRENVENARQQVAAPALPLEANR